MAAGVLSHRLPDLRIESAGLSAVVGHRADPLARELLIERDIDIDGHIARQVTLSMITDATVIFVMTGVQKRFIESRYPFSTGRTFRLGHHRGLDVIDPYRKDRSVFERVLSTIDAALDDWYMALHEMNATVM
jgi:Protein-tyrosine-phosphatase